MKNQLLIFILFCTISFVNAQTVIQMGDNQFNSTPPPPGEGAGGTTTGSPSGPASNIDQYGYVLIALIIGGVIILVNRRKLQQYHNS